MGRPRLRFVVATLAVGLTASACLGGGSGAARREPTTTTTNGPGCQFIVASEAARAEPSPISMPVYLTGASAENTVCYDKITFTFTPGPQLPGQSTTTTTTALPGATTSTTSPATAALPPGYTVQYAQPPFAPGLQSETQGIPTVHAILEVTIRPAALRTGGSNGTLTYQGPLRLPLAGMSHTQSVELLSNFPQSAIPAAATVVWLIGLDVKRPFTTDYANDPPRLSVLILN